MVQAAALAIAVPFAAVDGARVALVSDDDVTISDRVAVSRSQWGERWPFSIDTGEMTCVEYAGSRTVFFSEVMARPDFSSDTPFKLPRSVIVTTNPWALLATVENRELYLPFDSLETLIRRLAPFEAFGTKLCDQPRQSGAGDL